MQFGKINRVWLVLLFAGGGASLILLSLYDIILVKSLKLQMPIPKVLRVSYIINALNAIVGFGGFIGAGVRAFVYKIIHMILKARSLYFNYINFHVNRT